MIKCRACGTQIDFPFSCSYCGDFFCAEHRIPESHECPNLPKETPEYYKERKSNQKAIRREPNSFKSNGEFVSQGPLHFEKDAGWKKKQKEKRKRNLALATLLTAIFFVALVLILVNPNILGLNTNSTNNLSITPSANPTTSAQIPTNNPSVTSSVNSANATPFPSPSVTTQPLTTPVITESRTDLLNYVLALINADRQSHSLQNVTLSSINSGQQHADDMLNNSYFSHWDLQGYKPYMRYTLAGGKGAVAENCAWMWSTGSITDIQGTLNKLEYSMMYDDASSNWGHRDTILEPSHNKVSIGIAYDRSHVYLVQDFEDNYVDWTTLTASSNHVEMHGTLQSSVTISQVAIYYDKVSTLTTQQLSNFPYQDGYDSGTYVGQVLAPAPAGSHYNPPSEGILIEATSWIQTIQSFDITFDLSSAFAQSGRGVYTLLLWSDSNNYLTTYSIWNT